MKYLFLFFFSFTFITKAQCQLDKGTWLVGGSGSFQSYKNDFQMPPNSVQYKVTTISISSSVGYFIMEKLALGLRPTYSLEKEKAIGSTGNVGGGESNYSILELGAFGRWYFLNKKKNYNILSDLSYHYGIYSNFGTNTGHTNTFKFLTGPEFYFNSSVGIELLLGYSSRKVLNKDGTSNFNKGFLTTIGFQIHLEKK